MKTRGYISLDLINIALRQLSQPAGLFPKSCHVAEQCQSVTLELLVNSLAD